MEAELSALELAEWQAFFSLEHKAAEERRLTHIAQAEALRALK